MNDALKAILILSVVVMLSFFSISSCGDGSGAGSNGGGSADHCKNGTKDVDEIAVDCGGSCGQCHCENGTKDGDETDVDCGGSTCLTKCAQGKTCGVTNENCLSGFCMDGVCCDTACGEQCDSCSLLGSVGKCGHIPIGIDDKLVGIGVNKCEGDDTISCDGSNFMPCRDFTIYLQYGAECTIDPLTSNSNCKVGACVLSSQNKMVCALSVGSLCVDPIQCLDGQCSKVSETDWRCGLASGEDCTLNQMGCANQGSCADPDMNGTFHCQ